MGKKNNNRSSKVSERKLYSSKASRTIEERSDAVVSKNEDIEDEQKDETSIENPTPDNKLDASQSSVITDTTISRAIVETSDTVQESEIAHPSETVQVEEAETMQRSMTVEETEPVQQEGEEGERMQQTAAEGEENLRQTNFTDLGTTPDIRSNTPSNQGSISPLIASFVSKGVDKLVRNRETEMLKRASSSELVQASISEINWPEMEDRATLSGLGHTQEDDAAESDMIESPKASKRSAGEVVETQENETPAPKTAHLEKAKESVKEETLAKKVSPATEEDRASMGSAFTPQVTSHREVLAAIPDAVVFPSPQDIAPTQSSLVSRNSLVKTPENPDSSDNFSEKKKNFTQTCLESTAALSHTESLLIDETEAASPMTSMMGASPSGHTNMASPNQRMMRAKRSTISIEGVDSVSSQISTTIMSVAEPSERDLESLLPENEMPPAYAKNLGYDNEMHTFSSQGMQDIPLGQTPDVSPDDTPAAGAEKLQSGSFVTSSSGVQQIVACGTQAMAAGLCAEERSPVMVKAWNSLPGSPHTTAGPSDIASKASTNRTRTSLTVSSSGGDLSNPIATTDEQGNLIVSQASEEARPRSLLTRISKYVLDPRRLCHNIFVHIFVCCFIPGPYFFDSLYGAYKGDIEQTMHMTDTAWSFVFATGSLSATLCGPGGFFIKRIGITKAALIFGLMMLSGATFSLCSFMWKSYLLCLVSRVFFWAGICMTGVIQVYICFVLFKPEQAAFAQAGVIAACRLGGTLGYLLSGPLKTYYKGDFLKAMMFCYLFVLGSSCCYLLFAWLYKGTDIAQTIRPLMESGRSGKKKPNSSATNSQSNSQNTSSANLLLADSNSSDNVSNFSSTNSTVEVQVVDGGQRDQPLLSNSRGDEQSEEEVWNNQSICQKVRSFMPFVCYVHQAMVGMLYVLIFVFEYNAVKSIEATTGHDETVSGYLVAIIPGVSVFAFLLGPFLTSTERLCRSTIMGFIIMTLAHASFGAIAAGVPIPAIVSCIMLGVGFCLCIVPIWTLTPVVTNDKDLEVIHLGGCYVQQSLWLFLGNSMFGFIYDHLHELQEKHRYIYTHLMFVSFGTIGVIGSIYVMRVIRKREKEEEIQAANHVLGVTPMAATSLNPPTFGEDKSGPGTTVLQHVSSTGSMGGSMSAASPPGGSQPLMNGGLGLTNSQESTNTQSANPKATLTGGQGKEEGLESPMRHPSYTVMHFDSTVDLNARTRNSFF